MGDWLVPGLSNVYTDVLDQLKDRDADSAKMFDGTGSNLPVGTIKWNSGTSKFEKLQADGITWLALASTYQINVALFGGQNSDYYRNASNLNAGTLPLARIPTELTGKNAATASKWKTARTITVDGDMDGTVSIDGSADKTLTLTTKKHNLMTKAEFESNAETNRNVFAGSGFVEMGGHYGGASASYLPSVNTGISPNAAVANIFHMGVASGITGASDNDIPVVNINGHLLPVKTNSVGFAHDIKLPPTPVVTHADATNSGLVLNGTFDTDTEWTKGTGWSISGGVATCDGSQTASSDLTQTNVLPTNTHEFELVVDSVTAGSIYFWLNGSLLKEITTPGVYKVSVDSTNANTVIGVQATSTFAGVISAFSGYPKSSVERTDPTYIRVKKGVDISTIGNQVFPYGLPQYQGADLTGLTGIANASFVGADTYSIMPWQTAGDLKGKVYDWDLLSDAQKAIFAGQSGNQLYKDGDTIRQDHAFVISEIGARAYDSFTDFAISKGWMLSDTDAGLWLDGNDEIIPIAPIKRRNQGAYHDVFNPNGTMAFKNGGADVGAANWKDSLINSTIDAFLPIVEYSIDDRGRYAETGFIGSVSSDTTNPVKVRPDLKFYDAIYADDFVDSRNDANKYTATQALAEFQNAVNGSKRADFVGDGEWVTVGASGTPTSYDYSAGNFSRFNFPVGTFDINSNWYSGISGYVNGASPRFIEPRLGYMVIGGVSYDVVEYYADESGADRVYVRLTHGDLSATSLVASDLGFIYKSTLKGSGSKLHCDFIGDPAGWYRGQTYTNTGASQTVDLAIGDVVWLRDATPVGTGVNGNFYEVIVDLVSQDISLLDFGNVTNFTDLGTEWDGAGSVRQALANGYQAGWTPLLIGENGEDYTDLSGTLNVKLSHKVQSVVLWLISGDNGVTWGDYTAYAGDYEGVTNSRTTDYNNANRVDMIFYTTHDNMGLEPVVNSEVADGVVGDVWAGNYYGSSYLAKLTAGLINKIPTYATVSAGSLKGGYKIEDYNFIADTGKINASGSQLSHNTIALVAGNPAVKAFPAPTIVDGRWAIDVHFKEMNWDSTVDNVGEFADITEATNLDTQFATSPYVHITDGKFVGYWIMQLDAGSITLADVLWYTDADGNLRYGSAANDVYFKPWDGNGWGDNNQFEIVDNVTTTPDENGNTILVGTKRILTNKLAG